MELRIGLLRLRPDRVEEVSRELINMSEIRLPKVRVRVRVRVRIRVRGYRARARVRFRLRIRLRVM